MNFRLFAVLLLCTSPGRGFVLQEAGLTVINSSLFEGVNQSTTFMYVLGTTFMYELGTF